MDNIFTQEQVDKIVNMYTDGVNIDFIISELNTEEHFIREVLKDKELDRHYNVWSDELYNRGIQLYKSGKTNLQIAYDLLVSENGFSRALKKKEIEKRTYSETNRKYKRNSEYFDNINTPNKAYILGLIYADGNNYIWGNKHCFSLSLQEEDKSILERIRDELEYEGELQFVEISKKNPNHKNAYKLVITDEHMCNQLKKIGVVERKSLILTFPTFLRPDLIRHFVRGYFDGDGCISRINKSKKWHTITAGTYEFCSSLSNILKSIFIKNNVRQPKQSIGKNTYTISTAANLSTYKFLSWLYQDCDMKLERKYQRYLQMCKEYTNPKGNVKSL